MQNKTFIPFYLNNTIVNNLFTIAIHTFVEIKSVNTRNQVCLNINAPLSEILYDTCGQCIQGDFNLQLLNDFSKQKTEEKISTDILIFMKLIDILEQQHILKDVDTLNDINNIEINDYVQFTSKLNLNPQIKYIEDLIKALQMELAFPEENDISHTNKKEVLSDLKKNLEDFKNTGCIRFISDHLYNLDAKFIVPLETKYMQDNLEYLNNANISVLGKVVNISKDKASVNRCLKSGSCFDYVNEEHFNNLKNRLLNNTALPNDFNFQRTSTNYPVIEIIPFAMYI